MEIEKQKTMNPIKELIKFTIDILKLPSFRFYKIPLKNKFSGKAYVLANGVRK